MTVAHTNLSGDLAFDLFAEWEDRQAYGDPVSLDEVCVGHPELLGEVREIANRLAVIPGLGVFAVPKRPEVPEPDSSTTVDPGWVEIGRGASSVVYRGHDHNLGTTVAYKVLHPRDETLTVADTLRLMRRFELEARILARLKHQAIVRIYKTFLHGRRPALEMEYLPGGTLTSRHEELRAQGPVAVARFMERVARAVGFAHSHGIVHRDLKPSNILLDAVGLPCVSDFGVAKLLHQEERIDLVSDLPVPTGGASESDVDPDPATRDGRQPGTWEYMAPEQFDSRYGSIASATDVWALGVILYQLLSGERPFSGAVRDHVRELVCRGPVPPVSGIRLDVVGRRLLRVSRRCLEKHPGHRFATAEALADALRDAAAPGRSWLAVGGVILSVGLALGVVNDHRPPNSASALEALRTPAPKSAPVWSGHPAVKDARAKLARGERVVLIDEGKPPETSHWASGPESGKILRSQDGLFRVSGTAPGGGLLELVPDLPPGRYQIDAELKHETANGLSWVGVYAGATHWEIPRGRQHFFVFARYADVGGFAEERAGANTALANRRLHLQAIYLGDSDRDPLASAAITAPQSWDRPIAAPPYGWRTVSLTIDLHGATAAQGQNEKVGELGIDAIEQLRDQVASKYTDLGAEWTLRMHGGVGLCVHNGTASVKRFEIIPLGTD
jgi:serine/threonine protein kinase